MPIVKVLIPKPFDFAFDYIDEVGEMSVGDLVFAPFQNKVVIGLVMAINQESLGKNLKKVLGAVIVKNQKINFNQNIIRFIEFLGLYYASPLGLVLSMTLLDSKYFIEVVDNKKKAEPIELNRPNLSAEQNAVAEQLSLNGFGVSLLDGITGSGKTLVYFSVIEKILEQGKQVLILLPEISLTNDLVDRIKGYFGKSPVMWHSSLTARQKAINYQKILSNEPYIFLGARSAIPLPFKNLGLIVVDEEHDSSYKQEDRTPYNARDASIKRAQIENIPIILSSGTPSLESYNNAMNGKYKYFALHKRFGNSTLPEIEIYDMRVENLKQDRFISKYLLSELEKNLHENNQSLIFLNRRGFAPLTLCKKCGYRVNCDYCSTWMVYHQVGELLKCHCCGFSKNPVKICPSCSAENSFVFAGPGVERIEQELKLAFPNARIITLTSDHLTSLKKTKELFEQVKNKDFDIIIGTQLLAKGYTFPQLTFVGVIDGDMGLDGGDVRSAEKTFQLLEQVSGRAGRLEKKGRAVVQTYNPNHRVFEKLKIQDYRGFLKNEIIFRKEAFLPPFVGSLSIVLASDNEVLLFKTAKDLGLIMDFLKKKGVKIYGPAPASLYKMKGKYRFRLLFLYPKTIKLQEVVKPIIAEFIINKKLRSNILIKIDVDPHNFR
jgi:primosomal protein N' (replication factor Y)